MEERDFNALTIDTYNNSIEKYINSTSFAIAWSYIEEWLVETLSYISKDDVILELGTGWWRDADYFEEQWYRVQRTDYADGFIDYNQKKGKHILKVNALNINLPDTYKMIFADAVLLHFSKEQMKVVLQQIYHTLEEWWYLSFSLKKGDGEEFVSSSKRSNGPRYFSYRDVDGLKNILWDNGFYIVYSSIDSLDKRIRIICQKKRK